MRGVLFQIFDPWATLVLSFTKPSDETEVELNWVIARSHSFHPRRRNRAGRTALMGHCPEPQLFIHNHGKTGQLRIGKFVII